MKAFEDLAAWQGARQVVNGVYALTRKAGLVKDLGLCGQIQRAAVGTGTTVRIAVTVTDRPGGTAQAEEEKAV